MYERRHSIPEMVPVSPIPRGDHAPGIGAWGPSADELDAVAHWSVERAGIDTAVFRFKLTNPLAIKALCSPTPFGMTERGVLAVSDEPTICDPISGAATPVEVKPKGNWLMNLGWAQVLGFPGSTLINVDCRPAALLARDSSTTRLLPKSEMRAAARAARELVAEVCAGNDPGADPSLRRADITVDLRNRSSAPDAGDHGEAILRAFAGAKVPRWQPKPHPRPKGHGNLGGVTFHTEIGGLLVFRAYDKGWDLSQPKHRIRVEPDDPEGKATYQQHPEACAAGTLLRLERQWRPTNAADSLTLDDWDELDLRALFLGQFSAWDNGDRPPVVCGYRAAEDHAQRLFASDQITRQRMNTILGQIALIHNQVFSDSQAGRHNGNKAAELSLRKAGVILDCHLPRHAEVRLGDLVLMAADSLPRLPELPDPPDWFSE